MGGKRRCLGRNQDIISNEAGKFKWNEHPFVQSELSFQVLSELPASIPSFNFPYPCSHASNPLSSPPCPPHMTPLYKKSRAGSAFSKVATYVLMSDYISITKATTSWKRFGDNKYGFFFQYVLIKSREDTPATIWRHAPFCYGRPTTLGS